MSQEVEWKKSFACQRDSFFNGKMLPDSKKGYVILERKR